MFSVISLNRPNGFEGRRSCYIEECFKRGAADRSSSIGHDLLAIPLSLIFSVPGNLLIMIFWSSLRSIFIA